MEKRAVDAGIDAGAEEHEDEDEAPVVKRVMDVLKSMVYAPLLSAFRISSESTSPFAFVQQQHNLIVTKAAAQYCWNCYLSSEIIDSTNLKY